MTGLLLLRKGHTVTASTLNWRFKTNNILCLAQTSSQFPENTVLIQLLHCTLVHVKYATFIAACWNGAKPFQTLLLMLKFWAPQTRVLASSLVERFSTELMSLLKPAIKYLMFYRCNYVWLQSNNEPPI